MLTDFSCGGVLTTASGHVVLIVPHNRGHVLALPKGHPEPGETPQEAALREVREETGFDARIAVPEACAESSYWKTVRGKACWKTARFYRMHVTGGSGDRHDAEVDEVVLVEPEEAIRRVNYDGEREVIKQLIDKGDQGRGKVCWGSVAKVATVGAAVVFVVWWRA